MSVMKKFLRWVQDQLSDGLEKSTVGTMTMFGCFLLIAFLTFKEGGSDTVDDLITTAMIVSATLMGVTSIADIFKVNKTVMKNAAGDVFEESRPAGEECDA